jgi:hypothetical protein
MPKFPQRNEEELLSTPKHKTSVAKAPAATIHEDATMHVLMVWPPADIEKGRKSEAATARQREAAAPDRRTNALPDRERLEVAQTCGWASAGHGKKGHMHCAFGDFWDVRGREWPLWTRKYEARGSGKERFSRRGRRNKIAGGLGFLEGGTFGMEEAYLCPKTRRYVESPVLARECWQWSCEHRHGHEVCDLLRILELYWWVEDVPKKSTRKTQSRGVLTWNDVAAARHSLYDRARESEASIWGQTAWPCSSPLTLEDVFSSYRACNKIDMRGSMLGAPGRLEKACRIMAAAFLHA